MKHVPQYLFMLETKCTVYTVHTIQELAVKLIMGQQKMTDVGYQQQICIFIVKHCEGLTLLVCDA